MPNASTSECGEKNMSSDNIQRQMDFILDQQAKFDARFDGKMLERLKISRGRIRKTSSSLSAPT